MTSDSHLELCYLEPNPQTPNTNSIPGKKSISSYGASERSRFSCFTILVWTFGPHNGGETRQQTLALHTPPLYHSPHLHVTLPCCVCVSVRVCVSVLRNIFLVSCVLLACSALFPVLWHLWIYAGSANSNFYYAITLLFNVAQVHTHTHSHIYTLTHDVCC